MRGPAPSACARLKLLHVPGIYVAPLELPLARRGALAARNPALRVRGAVGVGRAAAIEPGQQGVQQRRERRHAAQRLVVRLACGNGAAASALQSWGRDCCTLLAFLWTVIGSHALHPLAYAY